MNEPDAELGEASHDVSPMLNESNEIISHPPGRISPDPNITSSPDHTPQPYRPLSPPPQIRNVRRSHPFYHRPPPWATPQQAHAFQQVANTLKLQSLALKNQNTNSTNFFLQSKETKPLEVDDREEDVRSETHFQLCLDQHFARHRRASGGLSGQSTDANASSSSTDKPAGAESRSLLNPDVASAGPIPPELAVDPDIMDTGECLKDSTGVAAESLESNRAARLSPRPIGNPLRRYSDRIFFRRSAQAASSSPHVVHRPTRMRKRRKSKSGSAPLPRQGNKGNAVAAELDELRSTPR